MLALSALAAPPASAAEPLPDSVFWFIPGDEVHDCGSGLVLLFPLEKPFRQWVTRNEGVCDPTFPLLCEAVFEVSEGDVTAELYRIDDPAALDTDGDGSISTNECQAASDDISMLVPSSLIATGTVRYEFHGRWYQEPGAVAGRYGESVVGTLVDLATGKLMNVQGNESGIVRVDFATFVVDHQGDVERLRYWESGARR